MDLPITLPIVAYPENTRLEDTAPITKIISKCLSADKRDRYQDAQDLFSHIDEVFVQLETEGSSAENMKPFKRWIVSEVCELVRSIGSAFADKATIIGWWRKTESTGSSSARCLILMLKIRSYHEYCKGRVWLHEPPDQAFEGQNRSAQMIHSDCW